MQGDKIPHSPQVHYYSLKTNSLPRSISEEATLEFPPFLRVSLSPFQALPGLHARHSVGAAVPWGRGSRGDTGIERGAL